MLKFKENTCLKRTCRPNQNMLFISNKHVLWESTQFPKCVSAQHYMLREHKEHKEHWVYKKDGKINFYHHTFSNDQCAPKINKKWECHAHLESFDWALRAIEDLKVPNPYVVCPRVAQRSMKCCGWQGPKFGNSSWDKKAADPCNQWCWDCPEKGRCRQWGWRCGSFQDVKGEDRTKIFSTSNSIISGIWCSRMTRLWQVTGWSCDYFNNSRNSTQNWSNLSPIDRCEIVSRGHQGSPLDRLGSSNVGKKTPKSYSFA